MSAQIQTDPFAAYAVGDSIGVSHWIEIDQDMISQFGALTRDPDPMHVDPEWARANSPYQHTIAFGFLTISLLTHLLHDAMSRASDRDTGHYLNYGFDKLRLVAPVPVNSKVRGRFSLLERKLHAKDRYLSRIHAEIEVAGAEKPALAAEWLAMWVPGGARAA
ncbi:MAG: MaoC/PaaZ C-terminal domain-containing protein [Terricaulis sp.]